MKGLERLSEMREEAKSYRGALTEWRKACKVHPTAFEAYFKADSLTEKHYEVMRLGAIVIKKYRQQETEALQLVNSILA